MRIPMGKKEKLGRCAIWKGEELLCNYFQSSDSDDVHVLFCNPDGFRELQ